MSRPRTALIALALLAPAACRRGAASTAHAWVDRSTGALPALDAPRVAPGSVRVDGVLDEPAWARAGATGPFVHPGTGRPEPRAGVNAEARVLWDARDLYVAVVVDDRDPTSPFTPHDQDPHVWERSSAVELMLQPGDPGDNTDYFEVQVDVAGAVWDTRFDDYNQPITGPEAARHFGHQEWSSGVRKGIRVDRAAGRYTLELAIPWSALATARAASPPRPGDTWRVNLYSFRDGQRDALAWSPILGQGNFHRAARFGRVRFTDAPAPANR